MKKLTAALLTGALCFALFAGCTAKPGATADPAQQSATESPTPTAASATEGATQTDTVSEKPSSSVVVSVETFTSADGLATIEYLTVDGLADAALQESVNAQLSDFYLWQWQVVIPDAEEEPDLTTYDGKAAYAIVGPYLSATRELYYMGDGAAHPVTELSSITIDLETAEITTVLENESAVTSAILDGRFKQTYPDVIEDAAQPFAEQVSGSFEVLSYLTATGVALYANGQPHAAGDYWVFEANYADVPEILGAKLKAAVLP